MIVMLAIAGLLYVLMISWIVGSRDSDAAGQGLAGAYIAFAGLLLWIVLAILLLIGAAKGRMPLAAALAAVVLLPASAVGAGQAFELFTRRIDWLIVVPVLLPPIVAAYALWARLPQLQVSLKPLATSAVAGAAIVALTVLPFAAKSYEERPDPVRDARLAAEAKARQAEEARQYREQLEKEAAAFARLGPDSSLADYLPYLHGDHAQEALQAMKRAKGRQADAIALLQRLRLHDVPDLKSLDLEPTPELCQAYGAAFATAAGQVSPKIRSDYLTAAMDLEYEVSTIQWLAAHDCDLDQALTLAATNIRAVADSERLTRFADKLASLRKAK